MKQDRSILILGGFYFGESFINSAKKFSHKVILVDSKLEETSSLKKKVDVFIPINLTSSTAYQEIIDTLGNQKIDAIVPGHVFHVHLQSRLCSYYSLPSISPEAAFLCLNKNLMRERFSERGVKQPKFTVIEKNMQDVNLSNISFPCVVKPSNGFASISVNFAENKDQAVKLVEKLQEGWSYGSHENLADKSSVLVEEKLIGQEYSAEVLCENGDINIIGITGKYFDSQINDFELGFVLPSGITNMQFSEISKYIKGAYEALGISHGVSHCEFILTKEGPHIVDLNPRVGGAHLADVYELATGYNLFDVALVNALGDKQTLNRVPVSKASISGWFIGKKGIIRSVDAINIQESDSRIFIRKGKGTEIIGNGDNRDRIIAVVASGKDIEEAKIRLNKILSECNVVYE